MLVVAAGLQTAVLPPLQAATPETRITDSGIKAAFLRELVLQKGGSRNEVEVSTRQGIVTLSGSVDDLLAKDRLVKLAESIRGVLGVIDLTTVTPVSRSDEDLRKDIQTALRQDPATESYSVNVSVQSAVVTLTGSVGYYPEKQLATRLAHGVKGVKEVRNQVSIDYLGKRTDPAIAADVNARLRWDIWVSGGRINSTVTDGKVTLSGTIGSAIGRSRAFDDVWVNGVISVDDSGLKIDPSARHEVSRELKSAARSNSVVKHAILAAFRLDPRVAIFSPDVNVEDGVVVLDGTVGNLKARSAAEQDAKNIVSVSRVVNLLTVRLTAWPSDADMQNQLKAAVLRDSLLARSAIDVAVIHRVAYLSGAVDSFYQKSEARDVASRIKGMVEVRNHLRVEPDFAAGINQWPNYFSEDEPLATSSATMEPESHLSDAQVKKDIENSLFWSPFVDRDAIKVTVDGSVATLTGSVGTWIGYEEADQDAHKGGAAAVCNRLEVK